MAFTQEDLATLNEAISTGAQTVRYGDRTVTYHSMKEMLLLRNTMKAEIEAATGVTKPRRRTFRVYQSGSGN